MSKGSYRVTVRLPGDLKSLVIAAAARHRAGIGGLIRGLLVEELGGLLPKGRLDASDTQIKTAIKHAPGKTNHPTRKRGRANAGTPRVSAAGRNGKRGRRRPGALATGKTPAGDK